MQSYTETEQTRRMLRELHFSSRHLGYKMLCVAIPCYARNDTQSITKELYPFISKQFGYSNLRAAEHSIRYSIVEAWQHGDPEVWRRYFPGSARAPSNLTFISTLAEYLK